MLGVDIQIHMRDFEDDSGNYKDISRVKADGYSKVYDDSSGQPWDQSMLEDFRHGYGGAIALIVHPIYWLENRIRSRDIKRR